MSNGKIKSLNSCLKGVLLVFWVFFLQSLQIFWVDAADSSHDSLKPTMLSPELTHSGSFHSFSILHFLKAPENRTEAYTKVEQYEDIQIICMQF